MIAFDIFALVGATLIAVRGSIFRPVRKLLPALFGCSRCLGMWVGLIAGAAGIVQSGHHPAINAIFTGTATSCASILVDAVLLNLLGEPEEH